MAETKVIMPQMGESIFEGTITKWLKKIGDSVQRDEPLFEISTDKVDSEIPSPASGTLREILVNEGQTVQINTVVAVVGDGAAAVSAEPAPPAKAPEPAKVEAAPAARAAVAQPAAPPVPSAPAASVTSDEDIRSSPLVRRIAKENQVDLAELTGRGTGISGRVTKRDILSYIEQRKESGAPARAVPAAPAPPQTAPAPASVPAPPPIVFTGEVERVPMTAMRKSIAEHMVMSRRTSAHVQTFFEVDCSAVMAAREALKSQFESSGVRLTVTPFFIQAAVNALKRFPIVNSSLDGDTIVYKKSINVGMAVALDWGLIVPVIKNADEKNLLGLSRALNDLGTRARNKKLTPDDVKDGTFTITNPGQFGPLIGTPIINQPQVAIMGMGGITKRPVVINDAIAIRPIIYLSLSFDHRIIDGAVADQFMADVKAQLEGWRV